MPAASPSQMPARHGHPAHHRQSKPAATAILRRTLHSMNARPAPCAGAFLREKRQKRERGHWCGDLSRSSGTPRTNSNEYIHPTKRIPVVPPQASKDERRCASRGLVAVYHCGGPQCQAIKAELRIRVAIRPPGERCNHQPRQSEAQRNTRPMGSHGLIGCAAVSFSALYTPACCTCHRECTYISPVRLNRTGRLSGNRCSAPCWQLTRNDGTLGDLLISWQLQLSLFRLDSRLTERAGQRQNKPRPPPQGGRGTRHDSVQQALFGEPRLLCRVCQQGGEVWQGKAR